MTEPIREPAARPCGSCPYRRDVPAGLLAREEYEKLPDYDRETGEQPLAVFMCHQADGRLCAGWVGCHGLVGERGLLSLRVAVALRPGLASAVEGYVSEVPLFASGTEAAEWGLSGVDEPDERAQRAIGKLTRKLGTGSAG